jgi:hypothetical protein
MLPIRRVVATSAVSAPRAVVGKSESEPWAAGPPGAAIVRSLRATVALLVYTFVGAARAVAFVALDVPATTKTDESDVVVDFVMAIEVVTADAGTTESIPKPKAATVASATRLKVVFVDICFLSISRSRAFPPVGFG